MSGKRAMEREQECDGWQAHVAAQLESGLSVPAYCRGANLNVYTFYGWRRRARRSDFVEVLADDQAALGQETGVEVLVGAGVSVRVTGGFDESTLVRVVSLLRKWASSC